MMADAPRIKEVTAPEQGLRTGVGPVYFPACAVTATVSRV